MSITLVDWMGDDSRIVDAARVSLDKIASQFSTEQNDKLIRYLVNHDHWTPLAHVMISCRVKMPVFLARQYFKHSIGSVKNEISRRYVSTTPEYWIPDEWRSKPEKSIKQGSGKPLPANVQPVLDYRYRQLCDDAVALYEDYIKMGVAPEQARAALPQSMYTEFIDTASLVYWGRVYKQRSDSHAQKEWKPIVEEIDRICSKITPVAWEAICKK